MATFSQFHISTCFSACVLFLFTHNYYAEVPLCASAELRIEEPTLSEAASFVRFAPKIFYFFEKVATNLFTNAFPHAIMQT